MLSMNKKLIFTLSLIICIRVPEPIIIMCQKWQIILCQKCIVLLLYKEWQQEFHSLSPFHKSIFCYNLDVLFEVFND